VRAVTGTAARRAVHLDLLDATVRFALAHACQGWPRAPVPAPDAWHVTDRPPAAAGSAAVLVAPPTPLSSRRALDAFTAGLVAAVVSSAEPWTLPTVLDAGAAGLSAVPQALVDQALRFPVLRPRLERTLHLAVRGASVATLARTMHQSPSTTKRDVAELLRLFDAPSRVALVATAVRMGVAPA
jgi:DNA-binding CsgD family transcriptional regulator